VARPPVATERLSRLEGGRLLYRLKHRWRDGTTHVVFEPGELVERLVALVPPPRFHLVRYHGVLGPAAGERGRVVPGVAAYAGREDTPAHAAPERTRVARLCPHPCGSRSRDAASDVESVPATPAQAAAARIEAASPPAAGATGSRARRLAWAELLRRVFAVDVLECPRCGGRMRLLAAIHPPDATEAILECLQLPSRAPPTAAARPDAFEAGSGPDHEAGA